MTDPTDSGVCPVIDATGRRPLEQACQAAVDKLRIIELRLAEEERVHMEGGTHNPPPYCGCDRAKRITEYRAAIATIKNEKVNNRALAAARAGGGRP